MKTILSVTLTALLLLSCGGDKKEVSDEQVPKITLEVVQTFTEDPENEDSWYTYVRDLQADNAGNIYIHASQRGEILKFMADGSFTKVIGAKGEGPGEYNDITWFKVHGDSLYIWSRDTQRMLIYDQNGENYRTIQSESNFSYPKFEPVSWGFMGFLNNSWFSGQDEQLVHAFDHGLKRLDKKGLSFTDLVVPDPSARMTIASGSNPLHVIMTGENEALVSSTLYTGMIYGVAYDPESGNWSKTDSVRTYEPGDYYLQVKEGEPSDFSYISTGMDAPEYLRILSRSLGFFPAGDEYYLNFTYRHDGDARIYGAEVIDKDLNYQGFDTLVYDPDWTDDDFQRFSVFSDLKSGYYYRVYFDDELKKQTVQKVNLRVE